MNKNGLLLVLKFYGVLGFVALTFYSWSNGGIRYFIYLVYLLMILAITITAYLEGSRHTTKVSILKDFPEHGYKVITNGRAYSTIVYNQELYKKYVEDKLNENL